MLEALHMLAVAELVAEPSLRRALRTAYREFAVISTGELPHSSICLIPCRAVQDPFTVCACGRYMLYGFNRKVGRRPNSPLAVCGLPKPALGDLQGPNIVSGWDLTHSCTCSAHYCR